MSFRALLAKDLLRERRGKEAIQAALVLVVVFFILFLFSFETLHDAPSAAALALWLPLVFGGIAAAGRAHAFEADAGVLPLLRSAPVPIGLHGVARTVLTMALMLGLSGFTALLAHLAWNVTASWPVLLSLALGAVGLATVACLTGALAAQARGRDLLLPILAVPVLVPLLQAGLAATGALLAGAAWTQVRPHLFLMAGYDLMALGVAWLLWPFVLEAD